MKICIALVLSILSTSLHAADLEGAIKRFYADGALEIRNSVDQADIAKSLDSLTPSFREALTKAQGTVKAWREAAKLHPEAYKDLKPPPDEGPLFTHVYEGGKLSAIVSADTASDRAYVTVRLRGIPPVNEDQSWTDLIVLHLHDGEWLIDDILSNLDSGEPTSVRNGLAYPQQPNAEQE